MQKWIVKLNSGWDKFLFLLQNSYIGRFLLWFYAKMTAACRRSAILSGLSSESFYTAVEKSRFAKAIEAVFAFFAWLGARTIQPLLAHSRLAAAVLKGIRALPYVRLRAVGLLLLGCCPGIYLGFGVVPFAALLLAGLILLFFSASLADAFRASIFARLFGHQGERAYPAAGGKAGLVAAAIGGLAFSAACALAGAKWTLLALLGLFAVMAILYRPVIGILLCIAGAPFLPTMGLAGIIALTFTAALLSLMAGKKYQLKIDITGVFLGAFALVVLFYGLTSYVKASAIQIALLECLFFMSFFLVRMLIDNRARLKAALFTFCTSGLFAGLYGLYQFLSGQVDTTWTDTELFGTLTLRVYATFENPNVYGEYLLLVIPVCIAMIFISKRILPRFYYLGVSCLLLVNLALTYSRGCYLALLLSALVVIWFGARKLLSFGVVGLVALPFVLPDNIIARFTSISNLADTSTSYRLNIWRGTMNMLKDFWPLGIGLGIDNFQHIYPLYGGVYAPHAHSLYFQVLSEMGIGGLILLICLCGSILVSLYLAFRRSKKNMARKDKWFALFLLGGILAFLIQGVFDYAWYNYRVLLLFFIVLGIGSAFCSQVLTKGGTVFD